MHFMHANGYLKTQDGNACY